MCEPSLLFWLIEELLDTQTINGCRTVFDYLESRRERITAVSEALMPASHLGLIHAWLPETFQTEESDHTACLQRASSSPFSRRGYCLLWQGVHLHVSELSSGGQKLGQPEGRISCGERDGLREYTAEE